MPDPRPFHGAPERTTDARTGRRRPSRRVSALAITAIAVAAIALLVACGSGGAPNGPGVDDPPAPTITLLGTGFDLVPAGVRFSASFAVAPADDGAACVVALDGETLLEVPAPCAAGELELGPFTAGQIASLELTATNAGGEARATWTFTASAWAPYQRLLGTGAVRAVAGNGARLAVLRDADAGALQVFEQPFVAREPGAWPPGAVALEATLPRGRGAAIAWSRTELAWLSEVTGAMASVVRFAPGGGAWHQAGSPTSVDWAEPFAQPRLAISEVATVVGDAGAGDGGRWWARYDGVDALIDERLDFGSGFPPATPGDRAGAAVAAFDGAFLVGAPGAIRYPNPGPGPVVRPNGRVLVAEPDGWSVVQMSGGFGSGPGAEIGQHLAVAWAPTPVVFMVGSIGAAWARVEYVPPEPDDDGGDYNVLNVLGDVELIEAGSSEPWGASWLAVNVPPVDPDTSEGVLASALMAVGRDDGTVHVFFVPLAASVDAPVALGSFDASGATGAGAWVGRSLALPFGDDVVLFDLSAPPTAVELPAPRAVAD